MGRATLLALALTILAASSVTPAIITQPASAQDTEYRLIVFPFFLQVTPRDFGANGGYAGVYVRAYGGLKAVVDLNHNGEADAGEPVIDVPDEDGRFVTVFIGYSDYPRLKPAVSLPPGAGPLWLLVDRPVFAAYYWVGYSSNDYLAAYAMPPVGENITVPPIPGKVYVAPAAPEGAVVKVNGTQYELGPMDYLVINHAGGTLRLEASAPIAAALVALRDGENDTYATELVPDDWFVSEDYTAIFSSSTTRIWGTGEGMDVYAAVVTKDGVGLIEVRSWPASVKVGNDVYYDFGGFGPAAAVYYYMRNVDGGVTRSAAAAAYNTSKWWDYFGTSGYWVSPLKAYGAGVSTYTLEVFITSSWLERTAVFLDIDGDGEYEAFGWMSASDGPAVIAPPPGEEVGVLAISRDVLPAYVVFADRDSYYRVYAVPYAIPVAEDRAQSFFRALGISSLEDVVPYLSVSKSTGWAVNRDYVTGECMPGSYVRAKYSISVGAGWANQSYLLATTPDIRPVTWNMSNGSKIEVIINSSESSPMPPAVMNFIVMVGDDLKYWVAPLHTQCPASRWLEGSIPGTAPEEGPATQLFAGSLPGTATATSEYRTSSISPISVDRYWVINKVLELSGSQITGTTTSTTTTTTPPVTTTQATTTTTSPGAGAATTTTAQTATETGQPILEGVGVSNGTELTYVLEYSGTGPAGSASGKIKIRYTVRVGKDGVTLAADPQTAITENDKAMFLLGVSASDLFASAAAGGEDIHYDYGLGLAPEIYSACPVLFPGKEGEYSGHLDLGVSQTTYTCRYSNGVLQSVEAEVRVSYGEQEARATLRAYLEGAPSATAGLNTAVIIAVATAAAVAAALGIALLKKRA